MLPRGMKVGGLMASATLLEMKHTAVILAVCATACAGSSEPLFGGFAATSGAAVILAPATCSNIPFPGPTAISGILVELARGADACNVLTQAKQCGSGSGSTTLLAGAFSGVVGGSSVDPAGPGVYPWLKDPPSGAFKASTTTAAQVDAVCTAAAGSPTQTAGGSVTIETVSSSNVTGSMDLQFDNGQAYAQAFDAAICPVSIDVCSLFSFCGSHTCVAP
jgi:hypothetical protein